MILLMVLLALGLNDINSVTITGVYDDSYLCRSETEVFYEIVIDRRLTVIVAVKIPPKLRNANWDYDGIAFVAVNGKLVKRRIAGEWQLVILTDKIIWIED